MPCTMLVKYNSNYARWHYAGRYESIDKARKALSIKLNNVPSDVYYRLEDGTNVLVSVSDEAREDSNIASYRIIDINKNILLEGDI